ncbi:hypothetical protein PMG71_05070 [Roseofilum sp. BLCC_M154]|uniref:Uncharacterized protein n=1 Tax=Roseofilum acuticapitatum BLCC-M154 TaxID=3022444 RepID=A0ABT7APG6_9CYAN|nr:hypothetical protein [Roseofilum acuticapitatum]MDJ1168789.1 hypothetical protein [Roseofilum acuticapitatum BLCC-M154]
MHSPLTESIDILLPHLVPKLVAPDAIWGLKALTDNLAPILRGGFECRLSSDTSQVDFQQCIIRDESQLKSLQQAMAIATGQSIPTDARWSQLQNFLAQWELSLHEIPEIWLEYDRDNSSDFLPLPAIFVGFPQEKNPTVDTYAIATKSLNLLLDCSVWHKWQDNLERCFRACPHGVFVSHIGVMLSRNSPALRVNVKHLQPDALVDYLQEIGWQQDTQELQALMKQLLEFVDLLTVCLDVGQLIYPQIGLECILHGQPPHESRWAMLLDFLVKRGLCLPEKQEALLTWPGQTTPVNAQASWPSQLIVASLLQSKECFTLFDRRLSHLKLVYRPQSPLEAKAYLWFEHKFVSG